MSSHFAKPENALRKAEDLVKVGKPSSALKTLLNILVAKRYRLWSPTHEKIMTFYIQLAVDLRRNVKDALIQYRSICQQAQSASMEKVLRFYQKLCEDKANEAQAKAAQATEAQGGVAAAIDIEDLEEESPESIMLAAMSGEGTKERLDRQILTPWVKYLWECYRTILDVLRNNVRLEILYHQTARAAFDFCKRFQRNMEFRRLCEILRNHLFAVAKFQNQTNSIDLNSPETQKLYLETRFQQLKMAADLELWQEAYRTIEDIHENMRLGARIEPPPELMKTYYEKLSQIFWASSNFLFHAYSLHKCYQLSAQELNNAAAAPASDAASSSSSAIVASAPLTQAQRTNLASAVVLSALIISGNNQSSDMHDIDSITGVEHEGNMRLAQLLGFKKESPSRQRILQAVQLSGVLSDANDLSKTIFRLLENQFGPLSLWKQLKPLFAELKKDPELGKYVAPLEQLTIVRVLQQLSTVFKSMKIEKFIPLVPELTGGIYALERVIMNGITSDLLNLRFDHRTMTLIFPEVDLEHSKLKDQLVHIGKNFISMAHTLEAESAQTNPQVQADKLKERNHVFKLIQANLLEEHENVFLRQELIEKRKQELEKLLLDKERKIEQDRLAAKRAREMEEQRRLAEESAKREEERKKKETQERELKAKQALADEMRKKLDAVQAQSSTLSTIKAEKRIQALTQDLENIDKVQLMRAQEEILKAQQREIERRRKESARRSDYTVRAMRLEERELLIAKMDSAKEEEKEQFEADFKKYLEADLAAHQKALAEKERLLPRMLKEKNVFHEQLMKRRQEAYAIEKAKQDERLAIKAEKRRVAEERRRKEEEQREKERAIQAEKERLQREEEDRIEAEQAALRKKKEEERQEKLRKAREDQEKSLEAARLRQKIEDEAEAKEKERRAALRQAGAPAERRGWGASTGGDAAPPRERDLGDFRSRPQPTEGAGSSTAAGSAGGDRWGAGRPSQDTRSFRRDDGPPRDDRRDDRPRDFRRDDNQGGPRGDFRRDDRPDNRDSRDNFRRQDDRSDNRDNFRRGGDEREAPSRDSFGSARQQGDRPARDFPPRGDRDGDRESGPSRDNFRRQDDRPRQDDRSWGRGGQDQRQGGGDRPERDFGSFRRGPDASATSSASPAPVKESPPPTSSASPASNEDDGFTAVKKQSRR